MMLRADKLKKLKMPEKPMAEKAAADDLDLEHMPEGDGEDAEEATESPEEKDAELKHPDMEMLEAISDEDLLAEVEKRGLSIK